MPWSNDAEQAVLGAMLLDQDASPRAAEIVNASMFYREAHRILFKAMLAVAERGAVDPVTLSVEMKQRGDLDRAGGMEYIAALIDVVPTAANVEYHAAIVRERFGRRRLIELGTSAGNGSDPTDLAARALDVVRLLTPPTTDAGFRLLDDVELEGESDAPWLVDGLLVAGTFTVLYGPSEGGKSFLALDWALSVASGRPWRDRPVAAGPIVYIAAEGWSGLKRRVRAWKAARAVVGRIGALFLSGNVNLLHQDQVSQLVAAVHAKLDVPPRLVVFDTLNQSMSGGDENASKDMGLVIASAHAVRRETGATVLLVHHCRRLDEEERGHGSLRNAADTMLKLTVGDDDTRVLECTKQKDAPYFEPMRFSLAQSGDSLVIADPLARGHGPGQPLTKSQGSALATLRDVATDDGVPYSRWEEVSGLKPRTFAMAVRGLTETGHVTKTGKGRAGRYTLAGTDDLPF
jgi:hypothetical protein